jgi:hypothetical protein
MWAILRCPEQVLRQLGDVSRNPPRLIFIEQLIQCGILYDVTRTPRTVVNCYELR